MCLVLILNNFVDAWTEKVLLKLKFWEGMIRLKEVLKEGEIDEIRKLGQ